MSENLLKSERSHNGGRIIGIIAARFVIPFPGKSYASYRNAIGRAIRNTRIVVTTAIRKEFSSPSR